MLLQGEEASTAAGSRLAASVSRQLPPDRALRIYLTGELGAGKTTLVRGFLRALGITGHIRSPTYTLIETYEAGDLLAVHVDLYRVADSAEAAALGLREYDRRGVIWLIEWAERAANLPPADIHITLCHENDGRRLTVTPAISALEQQ